MVTLANGPYMQGWKSMWRPNCDPTLIRIGSISISFSFTTLLSPKAYFFRVRDRWWWFSCYVMSDSCDPMDCSWPDSSVHVISQAKKWSEMPFPSQGDLSDPETEVWSPVASRFFTDWATREWIELGFQSTLNQGRMTLLVPANCGKVSSWNFKKFVTGRLNLTPVICSSWTPPKWIWILKPGVPNTQIWCGQKDGLVHRHFVYHSEVWRKSGTGGSGTGKIIVILVKHHPRKEQQDD